MKTAIKIMINITLLKNGFENDQNLKRRKIRKVAVSKIRSPKQNG